MMQYPQITIPPRSEHLWRYTPWKRVHPTKVEEMPKADPIKFSHGAESEMADSEEIASIYSLSFPICRKITVSDETVEVDLRCPATSAGELSIESKVIVTLSFVFQVMLDGRPRELRALSQELFPSLTSMTG